ncbi:MAG: hypothetical protein R2880_09765 [Deinococcales bacterium]
MKFKAILLSFIALFIFASAQAQADKPVKIILVAHAASAWDSFWKVVEQGNYDAAKALGVDITILAPDEWCPDCVAPLSIKPLLPNQTLWALPSAMGYFSKSLCFLRHQQWYPRPCL